MDGVHILTSVLDTRHMNHRSESLACVLSSYKHILVSVEHVYNITWVRRITQLHRQTQTDTDRGVYQYMCVAWMASFHEGDAVLTDNTQLGQATL